MHVRDSALRSDKHLILETAQLFENAIEPLKAIPGFVLSVTLKPLPKQMFAEFYGRNGENLLELKPENAPVIVLLISVHQNREEDKKVITAVQKLLEKIETSATKKHLATRYRFMNYAYKATPVLEGYGEQSITELKAVGKKYHPDQFFQKVVPGGFKLSAVSHGNG